MTDSSGTSVVSCVTVAMPEASARDGSRNLTGTPSSTIVPASGATWPERMLSIVDFPDPFAPTRLCTSPRDGELGSTEGVDAAEALMDPGDAEE